MHISKIELENIKSHAATTIEFSRGTTAITGENGAGKTTIIEAIAWALFDQLDYKKEDFVRRGAKKGTVRVTFESGLDEREYIVTRDSGAVYHVTDPRLQTRIADKKEEVFRFLWQHLGLEPGTDLRSLFKQAIGVPQGTFTAIFLEGTTERKVAFDRLLKVEEYRQAAEKLRETSRFLDAAVASVRENIARSEGELSRSEVVESEHKSVSVEVETLTTEIDKIKTELEARQSLVKQLDELERKVSDLRSALDRSRSSREKAEIILKPAENALKRATEAAAIIETVRPDHERHIATLPSLAELERKRQLRDGLRAELAKTDAAIVNVRAEQKRLDHEIKNIAAARHEINTLSSKADEQHAIEKQLSELRERIASARVADERIRSIERELAAKREIYRTNRADAGRPNTEPPASKTIGQLETEDRELVSSLAKLRANLERDERFQGEIRDGDGLCPILSQKCLNLKPGETLESFLSNQFFDLKSQIAKLEKHHESVSAELGIARDEQKFDASRKGYQKLEEQILKDADDLKAKMASLEQDRQHLGDFERQFAELESSLKALADPAARIRVLEKSLLRENEVLAGLSDVEGNLERLDSERKLLAEHLDEFKEMDEQWTRLTKEREATTAPHRSFIANEAEAALLETRKWELANTKEQISKATSDLDMAETALRTAGSDYEPKQHEIERNNLLIAERRLAEGQAKNDATRLRQEQLAGELERFAEIRKSMAAEFKEKECLETVAETTAFIRDTLKEAAPRVARNYVYHISIEANQMFREITGNAEQTLVWGEDYAIMLEEDGYQRPFVSLSGGEQMGAALSVRLALLKQLTDIRIAFFDEPTTNMDSTRRENLAMQISRITHFDQLFVISHDETFDSYVDNVVAVG